MLNQENIFKIDSIILEIARVKSNEVMENVNLFTELGLDSLSMVELLVRLEEEFEIELNESDLRPSEFNQVKDIYRLISNYLGE